MPPSQWWISMSARRSPVTASASIRGGAQVLSVRRDGPLPTPSCRSSACGGSARPECRCTPGKTASPCRPRAAGWAVATRPWDPDWRSVGWHSGPQGRPRSSREFGRNQGITELRWSVPGAVDTAAAAVTGTSALAVIVLAVINRRRGWKVQPDRRRPAADAIEVFADTVDGWVRAGSQRARRAGTRARRRPPSQ